MYMNSGAILHSGNEEKASGCHIEKLHMTHELERSVHNLPPLIKGESVFSYISRLADCNGYMKIKDFLNILLLSEDAPVWKSYYWTGYDCTFPSIGSALFLPDNRSWLLESSLMKPYSFFMSTGWLARKVRAYIYNNPHNINILKDIPNLYSVPSVCPICADSDVLNYGNLVIRNVHQFPGIETCPYHGCRLLKFDSELGNEMNLLNYREKDSDTSYAGCEQFLQHLVLSERTGSLAGTVAAIKTRLQEKYGVPRISDIVTMLEEDGEYEDLPSSVEQVSTLLSKNMQNSCVLSSVIPFLSRLYEGDAEAFLNEASSMTEDLEEPFMSAIGDGYDILSPYSSLIVTLRDKNTGEKTLVNPHSLLRGWPCPNETADMTEQDIFKRICTASVGEDYSVLSEFKMWHASVKVRNEKTGESCSIKTSELIDFGFVPSSAKECIDAGIKSNVEADGRFILKKIEGSGSCKKLTLRCCKCRRTFDVLYKDFQASAYCRICENPVLELTDGAAASAIKELSENRYMWTGNMEQRIYTAKRKRKDEYLSASTFEGLKAKIRIRMRAEIGNLSIPELCSAIEMTIQETPGEIYFNEDFMNLGYRQDIRSAVRKLVERGVVCRLISSCFCRASEKHSPYEIADAKYALRHGKRIGTPVGDSLLRTIGLAIENEQLSYALFVDGRTTTHIDRRRLGNHPISIVFTTEPITEENWEIQAFLMTLLYSDLMTEFGTMQKYVLCRWAMDCGIDTKALLDCSGMFSDRLIAAAVFMLRGDWNEDF